MREALVGTLIKKNERGSSSFAKLRLKPFMLSSLATQPYQKRGAGSVDEEKTIQDYYKQINYWPKI